MRKMFLIFIGVMYLIMQQVQANPNPQLSRALSTFNSAKYDTALRQLKLIFEQQQGDAQVTYYLARSYFKDGQLIKAQKLLEANTRNYPDHSESHFLLGSVRFTLVREVNPFRKWGLAKSALKSWQDAMALDNQHIEGRYGLASFYVNAPGIIGGDLDKARHEMQLLREISEPYSLLVKSSLSSKDKEFVEAEKFLLQAIDAIPDRAFPTLILADFYFRQDRFEDALLAVSSYRKRDRTWNDPNESQTALLAGRIYHALDDTVKARLEYVLALNSKPSKALKKRIQKGIDAL